MSEEPEDDYLSDKFLVEASESSSKKKTYSNLRKEAAKRSQSKNEQNRLKSRRQRELEAREEGLRKSLFERAKEEQDAGLNSGNKALSIMMKMGFKPGQALGSAAPHNQGDDRTQTSSDATSISTPADNSDKGSTPEQQTRHTTLPLPLNEWAGKKGIGLGGKRARSPSPSAAERTEKMAKMAEEASHRDFRDRARHEYEEKRAEGRLGPAQRTCATLDEQAGKTFNVLWLNPNNPNTFPVGLIDALALHSNMTVVVERPGETLQQRLRRQMETDALKDNGDDDEPSTNKKSAASAMDQYSSDILEEATQFLRLQAQDRLHLALSYLRNRHNYCFWCGVEYKDDEEMETQCPGLDEDEHN